tara:strand:- start:19751 stop:20884 length:1134 start_codon:yes stop_codon:yes gene_type:complete
LKTWLRRIHLAFALVSAIFLVNLSLTGTLLVFAKDIQAWCNPQYWTVAESQILKRQNIPLPTSEIVKQIELLSPSSILFIERNESPSGAWQVRLADKSYVSVNQYTGDVLLHYQYQDTFYGFVMGWHRWLLYTEGDEHPLGLLPPLASLILCIELILGFYLWARPKNRLKRLKVRWQAKNKVRFMQLHNVLGVYSLIPLFLIAFSGLAFYFKDATQAVVEVLTLSQIQTPEKVTLSTVWQAETLKTTPENYQLDKAVASAQAVFEDAWVYRVYMPQSQEEPVKLRMRRPDESHAYSYSWSNPFTGDAIDSFDASQASLATRVWNFKYSFHIGNFIALPVKFIWLFLGLLPTFFVVSGIYIFVKRGANPNANVKLRCN